jgi:Ni,Fe-hydrogenase III small subunit
VSENAKPRVAVFKMASCDGCQLQLLDAEEALLEIAGAIDIVNFAEASSDMRPGPYDVTLVEGSVSTPEQIQQIGDIRLASSVLITIGACATAGGVQALRNATGRHDEFIGPSTPRRSSSTLEPHPIADYVPVDLELGLPDRPWRAAHDDHRAAPRRDAADLDVPGLRGVQAPRLRVRGGGEGRAVPGPGDAHGLRRAVPRLRTRVLRVLRSRAAVEQHGGARKAVHRAGPQREGYQRPIPVHHRLGAPFREAADAFGDGRAEQEEVRTP